ncbi:MAG: glycoside hydrolase family 48 protein, partial [Actinocrinis sp.]
SGFTASVTIKNLGAAWTNWSLGYSYTGSQRLTNGWSATWSQSGTNVTAANAPWNGSVATNATVTIGANFNYSGTNTNPTVFSINGTVCGGAHTAPAVAITSPAAGATYTAPGTVPLTATASASDGATISTVAYYSGTTLIGSATAAPYAVSWTGVAAGGYSITAVATDSLGATTTSAPVGITVSSGPSIVASPTTLTLAQGSTGTFGVTLNAMPTANVTVVVARASGGNTGLSVTAGASLTFTPTNYNTAQNVTLTADASSTGAATFNETATGYTAAAVTATETGATGQYTQDFLTLYNEITNPANGYFSSKGIPYHSVETLIVEAPDYGHETTSEAWSYLIWLQATYGEVTGDWSKFNNAWSLMEQYMIPSHAAQPSNSSYNPASPAQYAPEEPLPSDYPVATTSSVSTGNDPLAAELDQTYGTWDIYGMHWLEDVDNKYGFGDTPSGGCELGPGATNSPSFINTFQRGAQESVWETVPQPTCDNMKYGGTNGYLDLFIAGSNTPQWKYTDAPDADARAIQAAYWADTWAKAQGKESSVTATVAKAGKMGDYLRYSFFDKYFKQIGNCTSTGCPAGNGKTSAHYLLSWYYAWGGSLSTSGGWAWRIGDGAAHFGYQNPLTAYALSSVPAIEPKSPTGASDWGISLTRQLQFYQWLQSSEGAIAGGATNSWDGQYATPPSGDSTFYGMAYDWEPVYHDPPSNQWFGMQTWSMERVAEYYYVTGNATAGALLKKWVSWAESQTTVNVATGAWQIPSNLTWTGQPDTWTSTTTSVANTGLHVTVSSYGQDVGLAASLAKTLSYYGKKANDSTATTLAKNLLDVMWANDRDSIGVVTPETRTDYNRFNQVYSTSNVDQDGLYIPSGWTGTMPDGDAIKAGDTFLSIRSWYTSDPQWSKVQSYLNGGAAPSFVYHRFWAQSDIAMAYAVYGMLFNA